MQHSCGLSQQSLMTTKQPKHPHWDKVLNHIGQDLNAPLRDSPWAQKAGIRTGAQYLRAWIACLIKYPFSPLPYLFLYGPENSGKSIFHEAIALLMTKGCVPADRALTSTSDFNGELANCILAVVEEKDISKAKGALNKIKEWVTARNISIRKMRHGQLHPAEHHALGPVCQPPRELPGLPRRHPHHGGQCPGPFAGPGNRQREADRLAHGGGPALHVHPDEH